MSFHKKSWKAFIASCVNKKDKEVGVRFGNSVPIFGVIFDPYRKKLKKECEKEHQFEKRVFEERAQIARALKEKKEWAKNYHKSVTDLQIDLGVSPTLAAANRASLYKWHIEIVKEQVCAYRPSKCQSMGKENYELRLNKLKSTIAAECGSETTTLSSL